MNSPPVQPTRFVALDLHKHYVTVGAVDAQQQIVLPVHRLSFDELALWAPKHLKPTDALVLEATTNAWHLYDQLLPLVSSVTVAHPLLVKLIASARVKTDSRDTINLARLLSAGLIPAVWVPPKEVQRGPKRSKEVRELRALVAHRQRLITQRTQARNRLRSALSRHNLLAPPGDPFGPTHRLWWQRLDLDVSEQLRVRQDLAILDALEPLLTEVEGEFARLSQVEPWANQVTFLLQLPGIGLINAMVLLAAIGDISRLPTAKHLVGYSGLGASVYLSGQVARTGRITKQGRREIRTAMVEAAWVAVEHFAHWKAQFERLESRIGRGKAIVAIARKLLVIVWHVLSGHVADRNAEPERVALKLMNWSRRVGRERRGGLKTSAFVRRQLDTLGLGHSLEVISRPGVKLRLPPSQSGLAPPESQVVQS